MFKVRMGKVRTAIAWAKAWRTEQNMHHDEASKTQTTFNANTITVRFPSADVTRPAPISRRSCLAVGKSSRSSTARHRLADSDCSPQERSRSAICCSPQLQRHLVLVCYENGRIDGANANTSRLPGRVHDFRSAALMWGKYIGLRWTSDSEAKRRHSFALVLFVHHYIFLKHTIWYPFKHKLTLSTGLV